MQLTRCAGGAFHRHRVGCVARRSLFRRRRPWRTTATVATTVSATLAVGGFVALAVGPRTGAYATATVLSGSMAPRIPTGSVVVATPVPTRSVRPGDVLTFHAPTPDRRLVTHRVTSVRTEAGGLVLTTKGDANIAADPWQAQITDDTVWRVHSVVPYVGRAITTLRSPVTRVLLTWVLPALLVSWLLHGVWRRATP